MNATYSLARRSSLSTASVFVSSSTNKSAFALLAAKKSSSKQISRYNFRYETRATTRTESIMVTSASNNNNKNINGSNNKNVPTANNNIASSLFAPLAGGGLSAAALLFPNPALAISITDPVFGDIEIWQFLILTAGYWIGIEIYLDNKYDDDKKTVMPSVKKKEEEDAK